MGLEEMVLRTWPIGVVLLETREVLAEMEMGNELAGRKTWT